MAAAPLEPTPLQFGMLAAVALTFALAWLAVPVAVGWLRWGGIAGPARLGGRVGRGWAHWTTLAIALLAYFFAQLAAVAGWQLTRGDEPISMPFLIAVTAGSGLLAAMIAVIAGYLLPSRPAAGWGLAPLPVVREERGFEVLSAEPGPLPRGGGAAPAVDLAWGSAPPPRGKGPAGRPATLATHLTRGTIVGLLATVFTLPLLYAVTLATAAARLQLGYDPQERHPFLDELPVTLLGKLGFVLAAGVVVPIAEEIIFRGVLQTGTVHLLGHRKIGRRWLAVGVVSLAFAVIHPPFSWPTIFVFALALGYVYERTGNLIAPIVMHAVFNTIQISLALLIDAAGLPTS
jgi:membrane protease YdiL (CAAX protease family)